MLHDQRKAASLANLLRRYFGTQGRDVRLERELAVHLDQSSRLLDRGLVAPSPERLGRAGGSLQRRCLGSSEERRVGKECS